MYDLSNIVLQYNYLPVSDKHINRSSKSISYIPYRLPGRSGVTLGLLPFNSTDLAVTGKRPHANQTVHCSLYSSLIAGQDPLITFFSIQFYIWRAFWHTAVSTAQAHGMIESEREITAGCGQPVTEFNCPKNPLICFKYSQNSSSSQQQ